MNIDRVRRLDIRVSKQTGDGWQWQSIVTNPLRSACMSQHMGSHLDSRFLAEAANERHHSFIGHRMPPFPLPKINKDVVGQGIHVERIQIFNQVSGVEVQDLWRDGDGVLLSCFRSCSIQILLTRNNMKFSCFHTKIFMAKTKRLANPQSRGVKKGKQKSISVMIARIEQLLDLITGKSLRNAFLMLDLDHTGLHGLGFGNAIQKRLVAAIRPGQELVEMWICNTTHANLEIVKRVDRRQNLVNGGVSSPGWPMRNRGHICTGIA